ncbi:hypothetical protein ACH5RR_009126 [Cinchona calisaya]|uniref:Uncharacterized protein n=1 Tax=Cinchona calisaya TaxID=153742 RepID=A0ABD3AF34_9GENT
MADLGARGKPSNSFLFIPSDQKVMLIEAIESNPIPVVSSKEHVILKESNSSIHSETITIDDVLLQVIPPSAEIPAFGKGTTEPSSKKQKTFTDLSRSASPTDFTFIPSPHLPSHSSSSRVMGRDHVLRKMSVFKIHGRATTTKMDGMNGMLNRP